MYNFYCAIVYTHTRIYHEIAFYVCAYGFVIYYIWNAMQCNGCLLIFQLWCIVSALDANTFCAFAQCCLFDCLHQNIIMQWPQSYRKQKQMQPLSLCLPHISTKNEQTNRHHNSIFSLLIDRLYCIQSHLKSTGINNCMRILFKIALAFVYLHIDFSAGVR